MKKTNDKKPSMSFRAVDMELTDDAENKGKKVVRMSVSSETPVMSMVYFNDQYQRAYEILDHTPTSINMSRCKDGLVIRDCHDGDQIGLMTVDVSNGKLGGVVEFCTGERAKEIEADAAKGLRRNVSVGYAPNPGNYKLEGERDGVPVVRCMSWTPYEASFEPVPADVEVGVGRAASETEIEKPKTETNKRTAKMDTPEIKLDPNAVVEIYRLARAFDMEPGLADEHVKSGKSVDEFRALTVKKAEADRIEAAKVRKPDMPAPSTVKPIFDAKETAQIQRQFSVMNVIRYLTERAQGVPTTDIAFELEISKTVAKRSGKGAQGIIIPHQAMLSTRADPFLVGSNGSNMVATNLVLPLIEVLRSKMVLSKAGMVVMSGLVGDVAIPKGGAITGGWVDGENSAATEGKPTISQVTGTPHTASGYTDISRKLLIQSAVDVQMFVQNELVETIARLLEVAVFAGTNANGQPKGLPSWSNINNPSVSSAGTPTWAEIVAFVENIETDNAAFDGMQWIMTPEVWAKLVSLPRTPTYGNRFMLESDEKSLLGFPYQVTMNATANSLWLGSWNQVVMGLWSGVDILVDPYTNSTTGAVRVVGLQDCDVMVRHAESFAYNTAVTA